MLELYLHITIWDNEWNHDQEQFQLRHDPLAQDNWLEVGGRVEHGKSEYDETHGSRE